MKTLELGTLTTELVSVLATQTGLSVGDAVSPVTGEPGTGDYPYVVVYEIGGPGEAVELLGAKTTGRMEWQVSCVGLTRLQAARARDFCLEILDPAVAVATSTAKLLLRETTASTMMPSDAGDLWTAVWRFAGVVTAV